MVNVLAYRPRCVIMKDVILEQCKAVGYVNATWSRGDGISTSGTQNIRPPYNTFVRMILLRMTYPQADDQICPDATLLQEAQKQ